MVYSAPVDEVSDVAKPAEKAITTKRPVVEILESGLEHQTDGSYTFHYRGEDGSFREETAVVKNPGTKQQYLEITGAYSFIDADDKEVVVNYKADDRGFVPVGDNIPASISKAAQENSQLPALNDDATDEEDSSNEEIETLKLKPTN